MRFRVSVRFLGLLILVVTASAQTVRPEEIAKGRVVMIEGTINIGGTTNGESVNGTGIVAGWGNGRVYIFTANHVVRVEIDNKHFIAENLKVKFLGLPGESVDAFLLNNKDASLDLAMLAVEETSLPPSVLNGLPKLSIGSTLGLRVGEDVFTIGYRGSEPWNIHTLSNFKRLEINTIVFETQTVGNGASGGGLFNENWELVGMFLSADGPIGNALRIDRIVELLTQWGYPLSEIETSESLLTNSQQETEAVGAVQGSDALGGDNTTTSGLSITPASISESTNTSRVEGYPCEAKIVVSTSPASMLNQVRTLPALNAPPATAVRQGSDVTVNKQVTEGASVWYEIAYGLVDRNRTGWLPSLYLELSEGCPANSQPEAQPIGATENVTVNSVYPCDANVIISASPGTGLNQVRTAPGIGAPMTYPVRQGSTISVIEKGDTPDGVWYKISYSYNQQNRIGWLPERFLELATTCPQ